MEERKAMRWRAFDYSHPGAYFITICTSSRQRLLSRIVGTGVPDCPLIQLLPHGMVADKYLNQLNEHYHHISVEQYVIMPDHIHMLLLISEEGQSRTPVPTKGDANSTVSRFVSTLKRFCNKEYGKNIWQSRFSDHVIRSLDDYNDHVRHIFENPLRWIQKHPEDLQSSSSNP